MDMLWILFKSMYIFLFFAGAFSIMLFLLAFKPTGKFIRKLFNAEIDWN